MEDSKTLFNILRKLSKPTLGVFALQAQSEMGSDLGDTVDEIFNNGVVSAQAQMALNIRRELALVDFENLPNGGVQQSMRDAREEQLDKNVSLLENTIEEKPITLEEVTKQHILTTLTRFGGNKTKTAQVLGVTIKTLYNKLHAYGYLLS